MTLENSNVHEHTININTIVVWRTGLKDRMSG